MDVSFISALQLLPAVMACARDGASALCLVKPQFEVGRGQVGRGGIVRDPELHRAVLLKVAEFARRTRLSLRDVLRCPFPGTEGNVEFFVHLASRGAGLAPDTVVARIDRAIRPPDEGSGP